MKPVDTTPNADVLTPEMFAQAVGIARDQYRSMGNNPDLNPVLRRLDQEPAFRTTYLTALKSLIRNDGDRTDLDRIIKEAAAKP